MILILPFITFWNSTYVNHIPVRSHAGLHTSECSCHMGCANNARVFYPPFPQIPPKAPTQVCACQCPLNIDSNCNGNSLYSESSSVSPNRQRSNVNCCASYLEFNNPQTAGAQAPQVEVRGPFTLILSS